MDLRNISSKFEKNKKFSKRLKFLRDSQFWSKKKIKEYQLKELKKLYDHVRLKVHDVKFYGSLLIPSKQFISRFKFRPWKGVYISDNYLNSIYDFHRFSQDLIAFYLDNNIYPVIETEFASIEKLEDIYTLLKI